MLFLAVPWDLRDRYNESSWLVYAKMVSEQTFTPEDVVVLSEWTVNVRSSLIQEAYRIRQSGARMIVLSPKSHESDEFKRQLCLLGIYDFLFVGDELVLGELDRLIDHPTSPSEVARFLGNEETTTGVPTVVDVYEVSTEEMIDASSEPSSDSWTSNLLKRIKRQPIPALPQMTIKATSQRMVWPQPKPVRVGIVGEGGTGKTFVAYNLAALCTQNELPTAVVDTELTPITEWMSVDSPIHVYEQAPNKGYRVVIECVTLSQLSPEFDVCVVVTFAERARMARVENWLQANRLRLGTLIWVINHHNPTLPLPMDVRDHCVIIRHDDRQFGAIRMREPLVSVNTDLTASLHEIVDRIAELFVSKAKGGKSNVDGDGVRSSAVATSAI